MFRHCVMFTWTAEASDEAKAAISAGLDKLADLDAVATYQHGPDAGVSEGNFDYVVVGDFASIEDYKTYATDEGHVALINEWIKPNISSRAAVQYHL